MVVLIVESVPPSLRGELSKWMLEPKTGVFVGSVSGAVRDLLWGKVCSRVRDGGSIMIHSAANEQGFAIRSWGDTTRIVEQWEGLYLVRRIPRPADDALLQAPTAMRLWGKRDPFHPLPCHMVDVGHVALELLQTRAYGSIKARFTEATACPDDAVDGWLGYLAALHDWGKCWRNFQQRGPAAVLEALTSVGLRVDHDEHERWRHEALSRLWIQDHLLNWARWNRRAAMTIGVAVSLHHGRVGQTLPTLIPFAGQENWEVLRDEVERMVRSAFAPRPWPAEFAHHGVAGILLSGLIVWADWIASNEELFPLRWTGESWEEYIELSRLAARAAVSRLGLGRENPWSGVDSFKGAWPQFTDVRPVQTALEELAASATAGLTIIEAPMGEGKTEAALYVATQFMKHGGGLYVALPTAATSNQMFKRVREFLEQHDKTGGASVQLVHGTSWLVDEISPKAPPDMAGEEDDDDHEHLALDWFRPKKRSLLATYGVGTIDQALMSVLHVKHGFLRLMGLSGKVLIVDEVHAYDPYMTEILTRLLAWCRALSIHVILLSATLPESRKTALVAAYTGTDVSKPGFRAEKAAIVPYPLITYVTPDGSVNERAVTGDSRRTDIRVVHHKGLLGNAAGLARLAAERLGDDGCLCVIVNTVGTAQAVYEELKRIAPDADALLLHGRFLAGDRQQLESRALDWFDKRSLLPATDPHRTVRPKRAVLVATQVVEQSLDLDFDEMISELAPIDLLLQRSGRLHRHHRPGRPRRPLFHIALPADDQLDFGGTGKVYAPYYLLRTFLVLGDEWNLPDDMRRLIEAVYGPEPPGLSDDVAKRLAEAKAKWEAEEQELEDYASVFLIPEPNERSFNLDRNARPVFEEDEGLQRYFSARIRYGNYTVQTVVVDRNEWFETVQAERSPGKKVLQKLMLSSVDLPRWWFKDVQATEGYLEAQEAPRWLPAERVLFTQQGVWRGRTARDEPVTIEVDSELGVRRIGGEDEAVDAI